MEAGAGSARNHSARKHKYKEWLGLPSTVGNVIRVWRIPQVCGVWLPLTPYTSLALVELHITPAPSHPRTWLSTFVSCSPWKSPYDQAQ